MKKGGASIKKRIIKGTIVGIITLFLCIYFLRVRKITEVYSNEVSDINSIFVQDGNTGKFVEFSDKEKIRIVVDFLDSLKMRKGIYIPGTGGYEYRIVITCNDGKELPLEFHSQRFIYHSNAYTFQTDQKLIIDGTVYH